MKKHTIADYVNLWISNLKYRRLLSPAMAGNPFGRNADWFDLPFTAFCNWGSVIQSLWNKEQIPAGIILFCDTYSMKEWDDACEFIEQLESVSDKETK